MATLITHSNAFIRSRPMPRARAHILDLLEKYTDTLNSITALEDSIEDVGVTRFTPPRPLLVPDLIPPRTSFQASHPEQDPQQSLSLFDEEPTYDHDDDEETTKLSPDEWLKKEEDDLKKLEAEVAEFRKQVSPHPPSL